MSITSKTSSTLREIKVSYTSKVKVADRIKITSSKDACELFRKIWSDYLEIREEFNILLLNRANHVLGWFNVSIGGKSGTLIDPKLIFSVALKCNACGIILCHNHPSGNLNPSSPDLELTKKIKAGGDLLEIRILDHLIISTECYHSMADEGILKNY
ncbi:MAG: JAB domain-containing protein [Bacteroidia bacterium]|nr:JAB domain-containing protein [Bacteroidia bacterium]